MVSDTFVFTSTEIVLYFLLVALGVFDILRAPFEKRYYLLGSNLVGHTAIGTALAVMVPSDLLVKVSLGLGSFAFFAVVLFGVRYWEHWPRAPQASIGLKKPVSQNGLSFLFVFVVAANTYGLTVANADTRSLFFWILSVMIGFASAVHLLAFVVRRIRPDLNQRV